MDSGNIVNGPIFLTLQSPNMISVIEPVLWLHLLIFSFGRFVIFFDITDSDRNRILPIISMYL